MGLLFIIVLLSGAYVMKVRQDRLADETKWLIPMEAINLTESMQKNMMTSRLSLQSYGGSTVTGSNLLSRAESQNTMDGNPQSKSLSSQFDPNSKICS